MSNTICCVQLHVCCNLFYTTRGKFCCMCCMQLIFSCIFQLQKPNFLLVVVPKINGKLWIYIDFRKLNATTKKGPYPLPFTYEVLNTVAGYETFSFLNGYSRYHFIVWCNMIFLLPLLFIIGQTLNLVAHLPYTQCLPCFDYIHGLM
jgi:hypothetical protein